MTEIYCIDIILNDGKIIKIECDEFGPIGILFMLRMNKKVVGLYNLSQVKKIDCESLNIHWKRNE